MAILVASENENTPHIDEKYLAIHIIDTNSIVHERYISTYSLLEIH